MKPLCNQRHLWSTSGNGVSEAPSRKRPDVGARIEQYRRLCDAEDQTAVTEASRKALADRHYLLVTRAAEFIGERLLYNLEAELIGAFGRFLDNPAKKDPGCTAKGAIARALVVMDCQVVEKGDRASAELVLVELAVYRANHKLGRQLQTAVDNRSDERLLSCFRNAWHYTSRGQV